MYELLLQDINGVIASTAWTDNLIEVVPDNYFGKLNNPNEYCKLLVMPSSGSIEAYGGLTSLSGLIALKIFVKAGEGQTRMMKISSELDSVFKNKKLTNGTELGTSRLTLEGIDSDNSTLYSASYFITFKHYGET
jgi:hypothetical protein